MQTDGDREVIPFESDSQAESIERGKASFPEYRDRVDFWGFAREGLLSYAGSDHPKVDVLTVSSWKCGLDLEEPIVLQQRFIPKMRGCFKLVGPLDVSVHGMVPSEPTQTALKLIAIQGIQQHPHGDLWASWTKT
jgi:hypothetical protein